MRDDLPTGTVTFLFTDVEGSTRLLHELGAEGYSEVLAEHRRLIREACSRHDGAEVDTQGDAFFFAFPTAPGAVAAASALTEALAEGPIKVRVGLHTGTPLPTEEGYVGGDVHRAARIAAVGHGGQVLVSSSTAQLVDRELHDLGEHRLKDLSAPERIYQLGGGDFPALASLYRTNLPIPATPFLGRARELSEVASLLAREDVRLLTLTGPGGTGKTRLALQAVAQAADVYPDGVYWVPLASLRDPALVLEEASRALGASDVLAEHIKDRQLLLLFDNFEHVVEAAPGLTELLASCPRLRLVITSRERLRVGGEQTYSVPPLAEGDGEALFVARARALDPAFAREPTVVELCRRLDELPLALELAAARTALFTPEQLLDRLSQRLDLLHGERDADPRQRTLRETIEWSYDLLSKREQELFARLSVFAGGASYEAAEQIAGADPDTLQSLLDKSLLRRRDSDFGPRFWMLETIREFAAELVVATGDSVSLHDKHLAFYLALVEEAEPQLTGPDQRTWYERLALEQENVRDALGFACDSGDGERALMLSGTIWRFWWNRGQIDEASRWYARAFAVGDRASDIARARGVFGAAHMAEARGDVARARDEFERAADLLRKIGETRWLILALAHLASARDTDPESALRIYGEALSLAEASGDVRGMAIVKGNLADDLIDAGEDQQAEALVVEALEGHRALGDVYGMASCLASLAAIAVRGGDMDAAAVHIRESLALSYSIRDALTLSWTLALAAAVVLARGDPEVATRLCGAVEALVDEHGLEPDRHLGETMDAARHALGERFDEVRAGGRTLDLASTVDLAIGALG